MTITSWISSVNPFVLFSLAKEEPKKGKDIISKAKDSSHKENANPKEKIYRQLTSLGRFTLRSQTEENPSNISFFVAFAHDKKDALPIQDFQQLWINRVMSHHERFHFAIDDDDHYFKDLKKPIDHYIQQVDDHPETEHELKERIQDMLLSPMNVNSKLWEAQYSTGEYGSSNAIFNAKNDNQSYEQETLCLFKVHHSLCDGVSISVAIGDCTDESNVLKQKIMEEYKRRREAHDAMFFLLALTRSLLKLLAFIVAVLVSLSLQFWKMLVSSDPFKHVVNGDLGIGRSVEFRNIASLKEIKAVAKSFSKRTTVNDVACVIVSYAIQKQIEEHAKNNNNVKVPKKINITIPVHLTGGILLPGQQLGNKIGGFVASFPIGDDWKPNDRVKAISKELGFQKKLPSPYISWYLARIFTTYFPEWVTKWSLRRFSANSCAAISNVRGFPIPVHFDNRPVKMICAFVPLPPGIPIGIVVCSYDGEVSFGLNCDHNVVPDAVKFGDWILEEYNRLLKNI